MPIQVTCSCGRVLNVPDAYAGKAGKCPACGNVVRIPAAAPIGLEASEPEPAPQPAEMPAPAPAPAEVAAEPELDVAPAPPRLQYVSPGIAAGGLIAPPPSDEVRVPTSISPKLAQPNCPPLHLVISTAGADVNVDFDASPVLLNFAEIFAKQLKKRYDIRLAPPPQGQPVAMTFVRLMTLQQGNRWLRYFLGLFAMLFNAGTNFEIEGNVQVLGKEPIPFRFKHRCHMGIFGGSSLSMLKLDAKIVAKKVAAKVRKAR